MLNSSREKKPKDLFTCIINENIKPVYKSGFEFYYKCAFQSR